ncbi:hypothetical protein BC941DRAFT_474485 [Chlamydoabsidia padenii]|nr:hypothetical protein BC941DRAFT_474485 [Chlamydoabsidia padenii]
MFGVDDDDLQYSNLLPLHECGSPFIGFVFIHGSTNNKRKVGAGAGPFIASSNHHQTISEDVKIAKAQLHLLATGTFNWTCTNHCLTGLVIFTS